MYYQKEFFKKKGSEEIAFDLISLFHLQVLEPTRSSTMTRALVFPARFHITKYFKQEVDDNLSLCVDECSLCGLSITGDIKIY